MADADLRAAIFELPSTAREPAPAHLRARGIDHSDPQLAACRAGGAAATAGTFALFDGGIGDGGGY